MKVQSVQSDLYTVNTSLGQNLDAIVLNVTSLEETAKGCLSCHHSPEVSKRLESLQLNVKEYQRALSYYITAAANREKIEKIKLEAAASGNRLLFATEEMSLHASEKLSRMTSSSMVKMSHAKTILYFTIVFTFIFGIIIAVRLTIFITRPTEALVQATRAVTEGDLGHTISYKDNTEFGELASAFNAMSRTLKTGYEVLEEEITERKLTEEALVKSEKFLSTIFDSIHDPFCIIDKNYQIIRANQAYAEMKNKTIEELIGKKCFESLGNKSNVCKSCIVEKTFLTNDPCAKEKLFILSGDQKNWAEIYTYPVLDNKGNASHVIEYIRDITERKLSEKALKESKERYELAASGVNDGLWDWDLISHSIHFSPRWKSMLGYPEQHISGTPEEWFSLIHPDDIGEVKVQIDAHINGHAPYLESEFRVMHMDKTYRWVLNRGLAVRDNSGKAYRMAGSQTDITARKAVEQQLLFDAFHDALTGLPNRALFMDRLGHIIHSSKRHKDSLYAVLFLDLDRFKVVNDSLGHMVGDQFLKTVSERLVLSLRPGDTVARLGGDEFALLLEDIRDPGEIIHIVERIQNELALPFTIDKQQIFTTASIGIAMSSPHYEKPEHILRDADIAMYQAKAQGRACHKIFDSTMYENTVERLRIETDLRQAVNNNEFVIHYQPVMDIKADRLVGFEALIRWVHPKLGLVSPMEFIPLAEETGLIIPIGEWILKEACRQVHIWQEQYQFTPPLKLSVNISGKQLSQPDLVPRISEILNETGLEASSLALEITESMIMENPDAAARIMGQLRDLGIHIHIDDFGTGYSSLSYIHRFPINALKIDRSFVAKMFANDENMEIIKAIISLAHSLNLDLIAEGLELSDQLSHLKKLKCQFGQGFLFSRPMEVKRIENCFASRTPFF
jgi:diguanylate cyclase (GGDEF)-like protein/PAS domain S-box-containing protein